MSDRPPRTIDVVRAVPPDLGTCRSAACGKTIEWVRTSTGARLPVDYPLVVERVHERYDGTLLATIPMSAAHFTSCKDAALFRKAKR